MINRCRKFLRLSSSVRKLFVQALFLLPLTALALRLLSFRSIESALANLATVDDIQSKELVKCWRQISVVAKMVRAAALYGPYRANCLHQSLVLWWLLRRQGIGSELRIGVRKMAGRFEAHAWVEWMGHVLNESADIHERFTAFDRPVISAGAKLE